MARAEPSRCQRSGLGGDADNSLAAASEAAFDTKVMRQAAKLHKQRLAERRSDRGLLESYKEAVEIGMHETWF